MKRGIELNGITNLHLILDGLNNDFAIGPDSGIDDAKHQLQMLERYMLAFNNAINNGIEPPKWHDVLQNPNQYPTNRERFGG